MKMVADYYRYISEFATGDALTQAKNNALQTYQKAYDTRLPVTNGTVPALNGIRLGISINFMIFLQEVM